MRIFSGPLSMIRKAGVLIGRRQHINFIDTGTVTWTIADDGANDEIDISAAASGSGAPVGADYLVGTADPTLTAEIVVGPTPGGELGGTWAAPTVDATHSGSAHHATPDAEPTADAHVADAADAHDASAVSVLDTAAQITATDVEGALAEIVDSDQAHEAAADPHTGYVLESLLDAAGDLYAASGADTPARLARGSDDQFLRSTATTVAWEAIPFSRGGTILDPDAARFFMVWRAPFPCTVTNVRGHRKGGTGATVNARRNQLSDHLAGDLSLTTADAWTDGGAVQNTAYAAGDDLEIEIASLTGTVTEIAIQVDFTRP